MTSTERNSAKAPSLIGTTSDATDDHRSCDEPGKEKVPSNDAVEHSSQTAIGDDEPTAKRLKQN